jgi:hypothetical protein
VNEEDDFADYYDGMNPLELAAQWGLEGKGE